jgi:chemotaxis protein CheX
MSKQTACNLAGKMIGEDVPELDALAQSAIAELANMITGQASIALEKNGYPSDMSPPVLLMGDGSSIATFDLTRLVVPLVISLGEINIDIAVKEA